jgi:hypothetical protein
MKRKNQSALLNTCYLLLITLALFLDGCSGCSRSGNLNKKQTNHKPLIEANSTDEGKVPINDKEEASLTSDKQYNVFDLKSHPSVSNSIKVVSLKKLMHELQQNPKSKDAENMYGLGWIEGYVIDNTQNDVLLYGREESNWPTLSLFDFIENLKNVYNKNEPPYCSLDPKPENVVRLNQYLNRNVRNSDISQIKALLGEQVSVIGGVNFNSRHALIMLEADYHMKKVSQGKIKLHNIPSYLELAINQSTNNCGGFSRFWFNYAKKSPKYVESPKITEIAECNIVLSTEAMSSTRSGKLFDSNAENPVANEFAAHFSKNFVDATQKVKYYADLENLFRLQAVMRALDKNGVLISHSQLFSYFLNEIQFTVTYDVPKSFEGLVNELESPNSDQVLYVMGGVSMEAKEPVWNIQSSKSNALTQKRDEIIKANKTEKNGFVLKMEKINLLHIIFRFPIGLN